MKGPKSSFRVISPSRASMLRVTDTTDSYFPPSRTFISSTLRQISGIFVCDGTLSKRIWQEGNSLSNKVIALWVFRFDYLHQRKKFLKSRLHQFRRSINFVDPSISSILVLFYSTWLFTCITCSHMHTLDTCIYTHIHTCNTQVDTTQTHTRAHFYVAADYKS